MAVFLVNLADEQRVRLSPDDWWLAAGGQLQAGGERPTGAAAKLAVSRTGILVEPIGSDVVAINGAAVGGPTALRPGDRLGVGSHIWRLDVVRQTPTNAEEPGIALPPPDPPVWRALLVVLAIALAAGVVALVVIFAPQRTPDPVELMPADARLRVRSSTVWVRVTERGGISEGSGFVSAKGWVLTNAHVVEGSRQAQVVFETGEQQARMATATVLKVGQQGTSYDIALLKVDTGRVPPLPLADLSKLVEGVPVAAFGFPLGSTLSTSSKGPAISIRGGRITAFRQDDRGRIVWVESDVTAEVGNSGGPLVTYDGRVVGLGTMLVGPHLKTLLAAPANLLREFAPNSVTISAAR